MKSEIENAVKSGDVVKINVYDNFKHLFFPGYLHSNISYVWDVDEEHVYVKSFRKSLEGKAYISSVDRYPLDMISIEKIDLN